MAKRKAELENKLVKKYQDKLGQPLTDRLDLHLLGVADPSFGAASAVNIITHMGIDDDCAATSQLTHESIESQTKAFLDDDVTVTANLLYQQVLTLNAAFNKLMELTFVLTRSDQFEAMFEAAMKAQEQSRRTLQTLSEIRNPKPNAVYIKNAIAQQVNQLTVKTEELEKRLQGGNPLPVEFHSVLEENKSEI
jgi:hypothetical protein